MNIHLKIQELRKNAGMSQEALAEQLGVTRQAVSKWESGINIPDIDKIIALSKLFDVSLSELLTGEKEEASAPKEAVAEAPIPDEKYEALLQEHLLQVDEMLKNNAKKKRSFGRTALRVIAALAAFYFIISYADKIQRMENNMNNMQSNMNNIRTDINHQIYSIQKEISESLKKEYGMVSDYTLDYRDMDFARRTVVLDISASPRLWNEGDSMDFIIESDEGKVTADGVYSDGAVTASVEVPLADNIEVSALIMNGGTTKQEKRDELYDLLSMHLLDVSGHGSINSTHTLGNDKLTMRGSVSVNIHSKIYDESNSVRSRIKSAAFEFIENGKATQTVDLLKDGNPDFNMTELYDLDYDLKSIERTMHVGDTYEVVVTVVDNNGVTYRGVLESIEILEDMRVEHSKRDYGHFEVTLPEKIVD